ncbi:MAG: hypothetical protein ACI4RF_08685, partial [Eubacterium sp.]
SIDVAINDENQKLKIAALTNHNTIQIYNEGIFEEMPAENIIDIQIELDYLDITRPMYIRKLSNDGNLYDNNNHILLCDVVYLRNSCIITRSGSIYCDVDRKQPEKAIIFDEWIERLK